jgi:Tfp pilus assembly protein PilN
MLRTNLSTRPFYNERAVRFWTMALAAVVVVATLLNVSWMIRYSRSDTELAQQAARDETLAQERRDAAAALRASVDTGQVTAASSEARLANELIDRRTFSWTALFNTFEDTLPPQVRVTSVRPTIGNDRQVTLAISVIARGVDDVDQFLERLESTERFRDLLSREEYVSDEGELVASIETIYLPPATPVVEAVPTTGSAR